MILLSKQYAGRLSHMNSVKWPCSPWILAVDRASARCSKGHGFSSCRWLRSFLCPKLVSRMLISSLFNNTFFWILWNRLLRDCCLYPPPLPSQIEIVSTISVSAVPHASIDFHIEIPSTYLWLTAPTCNQWYRNCRANRRIARTEANKPNIAHGFHCHATKK